MIVTWFDSFPGALVMKVSYVTAWRVESKRCSPKVSAPSAMPSAARAARMARWRRSRFESTLPPPARASAEAFADAVMLAAGRPPEHVLEDRDRATVVGKREPLDGRVVVSRVAGAVRDHRAAPFRQQHVHVARPGLLLECRMSADRRDRARERAGDRRRARRAGRLLRGDALDADRRFAVMIIRDRPRDLLELGRRDARRHAIPDAEIRALDEAVPG